MTYQECDLAPREALRGLPSAGAARTRESEEEQQQLDLIAAFMSSYSNQLIDMEGTRDFICVDGWEAEQLQKLIAGRHELETKSLPAA